jgi:hypothetical protein
MFSKITAMAIAKFGNVGQKAHKHSPEIAVVAGVAAMAGGAILLARAHRRSGEVHFDHELALANVEDNLDSAEEMLGVQLTTKQVAVAKAPVYGKYAIDLAKLYGPSVLTMVTGATLIFAGHRIQSKRIQGLAAALMIAQQTFEEYRARVREQYGDEVEDALFNGYEWETITRVWEDEDGKTHKEKVKVAKVKEQLDPKMYGRVFDETNQFWSNEPSVTEFFLRGVQDAFNDRFHWQKWISLNDVYKQLGFQPTDYGQVVGWAQAMDGDGFISFGLDDAVNQNPLEKRWTLNFNVDGVMWQYIGK